MLIKIGIIVTAYGALYLQIFRKHRLDELLSAFDRELGNHDFLYLLPVLFLLMALNWSAETWKWQWLIRKLEPLGFIVSLKAVLAGITVSMFTPNRVGEYFGRIFVLREEHRWEGVFVTIIGSMSQLIVTLFAGIPAFLIFLHKYQPVQDQRMIAIMDISLLVLAVMALLLLGLFFNTGFITNWTHKLIRDEWKRLRRYMEVFAFYSRRELLPVLLFSMLRYAVFSLQFFLVIKAFGIPLSAGDAWIAIPSVFLITTVYPSFTLAELGLRGSASAFVLGAFLSLSDMTAHSIGILAAAGGLWLVNLVLPALVGTFIIARMNFLQKRSKS